LTGTDKLPLVFTATCLNGYFINPYSTLALSEALVTREDAGAIAVWSPSALGYPSDHEILFTNFLDFYRVAVRAGLGSAILQATVLSMAEGIPDELASTFILLGDPMLQLAEPPRTRQSDGRAEP
jgi:hypothetical protein